MKLSELLNRDKTVLRPGAFDALSARLIEQAGFPIAYLGGFYNEASDLGRPDLGFTNSVDIIRRAVNFSQRVKIPVV